MRVDLGYCVSFGRRQWSARGCMRLQCSLTGSPYSVATDRWWLATIMMFGPRWMGLLPLAVLVPLALALRARLLLPLAATAALIVFGIMGLCVSWPGNAGATDVSATIIGHVVQRPLRCRRVGTTADAH